MRGIEDSLRPLKKHQQHTNRDPEVGDREKGTGAEFECIIDENSLTWKTDISTGSTENQK